ncbi:MAG: hypothetical protein QMB34_10905, partial [Paracoccaceae bacterium]
SRLSMVRGIFFSAMSLGAINLGPKRSGNVPRGLTVVYYSTQIPKRHHADPQPQYPNAKARPNLQLRAPCLEPHK